MPLFPEYLGGWSQEWIPPFPIFMKTFRAAITSMKISSIGNASKSDLCVGRHSGKRQMLGKDSLSTRMGTICLQHRCVECCLNTEMPLSSSDIARIRDLGFYENSFVARKNGNRQLRNRSGRCVFHNGRECAIYNDRPDGCRLYPAVFDEDRGVAVLDIYCPHHEKFRLTPSISRTVVRLVRKLDAEKTRISHYRSDGC